MDWQDKALEYVRKNHPQFGARFKYNEFCRGWELTLWTEFSLKRIFALSILQRANFPLDQHLEVEIDHMARQMKHDIANTMSTEGAGECLE